MQANILVDATGNTRIADFGLATVARDSNSLEGTVEAQGTTARYTAPEILRGVESHSKESDVFAFGMVVVEVRADESTQCKTTLSVGSGIHRQGSVQWIWCCHSHSSHYRWGPSKATHPPQFHRPLVGINSAVLGGGTAKAPMDRSSAKTAVSFFPIQMTNTPFIGNRISTDLVPQTTSTQPVELPGHESVEASLTIVTISHGEITRDAPASGISIAASKVGAHFDDTSERSSFLLGLLQSSLLPPAPANIFGRDAIIDDLLGFAERFASIILFGAGGIGKSAIALTLLHHDRIATRFDRDRHFICCDDLTGSLDNFRERLSDTFGAHHSTDMAQLLSYLALSPPCTLVLDGVDSFLDPLAPGSAEITAAIEELGRCQNVFLLATYRMDTRIPDFRRIEVPALHVNGARDTFYGRCHLGMSVAVDRRTRLPSTLD